MYVPSVPKAGGFTITSPPSKASPTTESPGYLELAVQNSPENPAAAWLWRPEKGILGSELNVRVGGSFVWPGPGITTFTLRKAVFVAGGVGINPLMSMISSVAEKPGGTYEVHVLYSVKDPGGVRNGREILFLERIATLFATGKIRGALKLFLTGNESSAAVDQHQPAVSCNEIDVPFQQRRITVDDVAEVVQADKRFSVVYVCGVPTMTDHFVEELVSPDGLGMEPHRVLCEKWW